MSYLVRELVINSVIIAAVLAYLPRAIKRKKNRTFPVTVLVMALIGLWFNLHGEVISGWQEGFHVGRG